MRKIKVFRKKIQKSQRMERKHIFINLEIRKKIKR